MQRHRSDLMRSRFLGNISGFEHESSFDFENQCYEVITRQTSLQIQGVYASIGSSEREIITLSPSKIIAKQTACGTINCLMDHLDQKFINTQNYAVLDVLLVICQIVNNALGKKSIENFVAQWLENEGSHCINALSQNSIAIIPLEEVIENQCGNCRHTSLLACTLMLYAIEQNYLPMASIHNFRTTFKTIDDREAGHAVALYKISAQEHYLIDPMWNRVAQVNHKVLNSEDSIVYGKGQLFQEILKSYEIDFDEAYLAETQLLESDSDSELDQQTPPLQLPSLKRAHSDLLFKPRSNTHNNSPNRRSSSVELCVSFSLP